MVPDLAMLTDAVGNAYEEKKPSLAELLALQADAQRAQTLLRQLGDSEIVLGVVFGMSIDIPADGVRAELNRKVAAWYAAAVQHGLSTD